MISLVKNSLRAVTRLLDKFDHQKQGYALKCFVFFQPGIIKESYKRMNKRQFSVEKERLESLGINYAM